jgi:hypothetical protein
MGIQDRFSGSNRQSKSTGRFLGSQEKGRNDTRGMAWQKERIFLSLKRNCVLNRHARESGHPVFIKSQ